MNHPFTSQRRSILIYSLLYILAAAINFIVLLFNYKFSVNIAATEAFIGVLLFAIIGLIIWYPTNYIPYRREAPFYSILTHVLAGLVLIIVWLFTVTGILSVIFNSDENYQEYLDISMLSRGIIGAMIYIVMVLIYYLVSYARRLRERANAEEKLRTLVKESELNLLKSQINPHFLFNSLNSVSSLIMNNPNEAREMIVRLSDFLRYSLKHRKNEFVTLEEELIRMQDYLAIEQGRFGDKLKYNLSVSDVCKKFKVPTMILQPLIENAIKHGVYESLEPVLVDFKCEIFEDSLILRLGNDFDPNQPKRGGTGMGLQNVSERVRLAYDGKGIVKWGASNTTFRVELVLPHEKIKKEDTERKNDRQNGKD